MTSLARCLRRSFLAIGFFAAASGQAFETWAPAPAGWKGADVKGGSATLTAERWSYLLRPGVVEHVEVTARVTIREAGKHGAFFGQSWSVWPDRTFGDQGWDAALLLRGGETSGYRVQLSHALQELAVVKFPGGGYLRSVPCPVKAGVPLTLAAKVRGNRVSVAVDGRELLNVVDGYQPLEPGQVGVGACSGAKVLFEDARVTALEPAANESSPPHRPDFRARRWLGGRQWVFDGDEPILLLPDPKSSYVNNVKLRPGLKPLLSFNSHWDVQNQGAYNEAKNDTAHVRVTGGGKELTASWVGKHVKDRFGTRTTLTVGYDPERAVYTYDVDSELEVLPGPPFHFRYGLDFEHHTPLDPFNWQYLVFRRKDGTLNRRPVYPVDPGPQNDLETSEGLRVWFGRHHDPLPVSPAVEYHIPDAGKRKMNTAVCAAFYDTGVSFEPQTLPAGEKVRVRYRYTGYPAAEAAELFRKATPYDAPTLDPSHHYIFAEWPRVTFARFAALSESWPYGQVPFMTGHNRRPTYELAKLPGIGSGYAMKLGPRAFGQAALPAGGPLAAGTYVLSVRAKADNVHGPGGRIELTAADKKGKEVLKTTHHIGAGSYDWKEAGFVFRLPTEAKTLTLGFGNAGTGEVFFADAAFRTLRPDEPVPSGPANPVAATVPATAEGALADYRMVEGRGLHALDFAGGPFGLLELANVGWVTDEGRPALRFADNPAGTKAFPRAGGLDLNLLRNPGYKGRDTLPVAVAGHHGGGFELRAFTIATWIKPAARMGKGDHPGSGDVVGFGARRIILRLLGQEAPYRLSAAINVNDRFAADGPLLEADRWYQVAVTGELTPEAKWRVRLYVDGRPVQGGVTKVQAAPMNVPPSLVLGAELFYFHTSYYRGLIGRTLVFDRTLDGEQLARLRPSVE